MGPGNAVWDVGVVVFVVVVGGAFDLDVGVGVIGEHANNSQNYAIH